MSKKGPAAEPGTDGKASANAAVGAAPSAEQVAAFLRAHPDFLIEHPDLMDVLTPPSRAAGGSVVDMQHFMLDRLRSENQRLRDQQAGLIATARDNQSTQSRVHTAVLQIVAASSFEGLIQTLTVDLPILLGIDVVTICIEAGDVSIPQAYAKGVRAIPAGTTDRKIGPARDVLLAGDVEGDPVIFGSAAGLVGSMALARLNVSPHSPVGLIALGTREKDGFQHGQGTELLTFLARTIEITIRQWLDLPG